MDGMLETSARLLRLLSLFQGRRYWTGRELAERLEVTPRTLRRDVDKLRSLGYPIHSSTGVEGGYQLGAGASMPPLLLDDEEAVAVAVGLRAAASGDIRGMEEAALRTLAKMEQILPPRLARRVNALQAMIVTRQGATPAVDARTLSVIAAACRDQEALRFAYADYGGRVSERSVEPHRLVNPGTRWYLVAWDNGRNDWRTFRVDRIQSRPSAGVRFTPRKPPADDLAAYVLKGVWTKPPYSARVKLLVPAEEMTWARPFGLLEAIDEKSCYFHTGGPSWESFAMHLALLGVDFEVEGPAELREQVARLTRRYARAAR